MEIVLGPLLCFIGQSVPSCPQMGCVGILVKGSSIMYIHVFLLGPASFAVCFASLLDGETHIWLGDLRFAFCVVVFVFVFCC